MRKIRGRLSHRFHAVSRLPARRWSSGVAPVIRRQPFLDGLFLRRHPALFPALAL
jgi:hypothetical protein